MKDFYQLKWIKDSILDDSDFNSICDQLMGFGAISVSLENFDTEETIFDEPSNPKYWRKNFILALFNSRKDATYTAKLMGIKDYEITTIHSQDWVRESQDQFKPIKINSKLWIIPSWHEIQDPEALNLKLDPGLAFGTGSHPTTYLCLNQLSSSNLKEKTLLDYGCGSGILAIAAAKMGIKSGVGVDIDTDAITCSKQNATINKVHSSLEFITPKEFSNSVGKFDFIVANILANPLKILAPLFANRCSADGKVILSGILNSQAKEVADSYSKYFSMEHTTVLDNWVCLVGILSA